MEDNTNKTEPTSYELLLSELKKLNERLDATDKRINDVTAFNKALLTTKDAVKVETPESQAEKKLAEFLKEHN